MIVNESYPYRPFAANAAGAVTSNGGALGGFACVTAGTLTLTENTGGGTVVLATMAVSAGIFYTLPFQCAPGTFLYATLAGGAVGTFAGS